MRFVTSLPEEPKHSELVSGVGWYNNEEVYSCGDDHALLKWNLVKNTTDKILQLPAELYPTDLQWYPGHSAGGGGSSSSVKQGSDLLLITSTDGKFHFINKNGRIEKSVEAHKGAIVCGCWSYDGNYLLTAGEDGQVKIWSRSGLLRNTVVLATSPVYSAVWSPNCSQILHTMGKLLVVRTLSNNSKYYQWTAHEGLVLKVAWHPVNDLIISGGEDCRYKIWDPLGRQLYCSSPQEYPITSLAWCPSGDLFAVGSFNTLRLCDKRGWSHSMEKPNTGSIFNISWSSDGTQVAGACGNGHVVVAHIIERVLEWHRYTATVVTKDTIAIRDVTNDARETLDFSDRIVQVEFGFGHLVVATPTQCHIFSVKNWNTPTIFNLRDGSVSVIVLGDRHFLLVERFTVNLYNYEGKLLCSPRWPAMHLETLNHHCVSISPDTIAVRDHMSDTVVHLFELTLRNFTNLNPFKHKQSVQAVSLNQVGNAADRLLAVLDKTDLLHLHMVRGNDVDPERIGRIISSMCWNASYNMLAVIQDTELIIWPSPSLIFYDRKLFEKSAMKKQINECGQNARIVSFDGMYVAIRRADGSLVSIPGSHYLITLMERLNKCEWKEALQLCFYVKDTSMWACLAGAAVRAGDIDTAIYAFSALHDIPVVDHILTIQKITEPAVKRAEILMLNKKMEEAETVLLENGFIFRAILLNMELCKWDRALELAVSNKTHVDTVLLKRKDYLADLKKEENDQEYLKLKDEVQLDREKIEAKIIFENERCGIFENEKELELEEIFADNLSSNDHPN